MKIILFVLVILGLTSCSMNKGNKTESIDGFESSSSDTASSGDSELMGLLDEEVLGDQNKVEEKAKNEDNITFMSEETGNAIEEKKDEINRDIAAMPIIMNDSDDFSIYKVQKNETLMWIAFKLYGDYRKWKDLAAWNGSHLAHSVLRHGTEIKYKGSSFVWRPKGNPYLIQRGDYLSKISNKVYGTPMKWKTIWENNRPMIRFPDLIFAGFTLYYVPKDEMNF